MSMTKEHYYELGRKNAFNGGQECPQPGTWRHAAFMQGFDDARREKVSQRKLTARQEHIRLLIQELSNCNTQVRWTRICNKIETLRCREALCTST